MQILVGAVLILYVLVIPVGLCWLLDHRPAWFRRGRIFLWVAGLSACSWCGVVGAILIPYWCGFYMPRGPELVFALFGGWAYPWLAALPVFCIYGVLRLLRGVFHRAESSGGRQGK